MFSGTLRSWRYKLMYECVLLHKQFFGEVSDSGGAQLLVLVRVGFLTNWGGGGWRLAHYVPVFKQPNKETPLIWKSVCCRWGIRNSWLDICGNHEVWGRLLLGPWYLRHPPHKPLRRTFLYSRSPDDYNPLNRDLYLHPDVPSDTELAFTAASTRVKSESR